jgi:hypothetical protein
VEPDAALLRVAGDKHRDERGKKANKTILHIDIPHAK